MHAPTDQRIARYAVDDSRPATFLERGVTVPFTTPILLGSRVRPSQRKGLELAVPSPGGVRGFYVLPLRALHDLCTPTLHDRLVTEMLEEMPMVTPEAILRISRAVAQEGLAGRGAAAAAAEAEKAAAGQRLLTNYRLLLKLIEQVEIPPGKVPAEQDVAANVQGRAERAVARVARELAMSVPEVVAALEGLATAYVSIGFRGDPTKARYQGELAELEVLATEVAAWGEVAADPQQGGSASLIARSAKLTLDAGRLLLEQLTGQTDDLRALLRRWSTEAASILQFAARMGWLLDGWSVTAGVWRLADRIGKDEAIREMTVMVPTMPHEVNKWMEGGDEEGCAAAHRMRGRFVSRLEDWRTGRTIDVIARNEQIVREFV